jgi:hypothetical protein
VTRALPACRRSCSTAGVHPEGEGKGVEERKSVGCPRSR